MPSSNVILFECRVHRVRMDCDEIGSLARKLAENNVYPDNWDRYDLKASARELREAADKLDEVRSKLNGG